MTLRWGIVTAGKISHDFVKAFNSFPNKGDQKIVAVAARDKTKATEFAKLHNIDKVFDTYKSLALSNDIDVVYIGALNVDHYDLCKLFLENGKHVLCEKPLCLNAKQVQSLINIAKKNKRFLMEAVWSRFGPIYHALEKEINSGVLGDIKHVEATFGVPIVDVERISTRELGGGALLDLGIYVLQFAQFIYKDEPTKVTAVGELTKTGVDKVVTIVLEYSNDRRAVLNVDSRLKLWNNGTVIGTKGRVTVKDPFHFPLEMIHANGTEEKAVPHESDAGYNFGNSPGLVFQALEVFRCIKEGLLESPRMSHNESLLLAKLEDKIRQQLGVHYEADDKDY